MRKLLFLILTTLALAPSIGLEGNIKDLQEKYGDELTSRFIIKSDDQVDSLCQIQLRASWWSRHYEYAWSAQFADSEAVVLDAACGISHPFKWYLGETCKSAWACDGDARIDDINKIIQETYEDLGEEAYETLVNHPKLYEQVKLVDASICALPNSMPQFDRIFCISTLEHLSDKDRADAMSEFARFLAPDGLLVLTVDYPEVTPEVLIETAESVGLVPAGKVIYSKPTDAITNSYLSIFRCVFVHKDNL